MSELVDFLGKFSDVTITVMGIVIAVGAVIGAFRAGILRSIKVGSLEIKASEGEVRQAREVIRAVTAPDAEGTPFETEQLASCYAQVLAQSRTSFWFSLVFACFFS